MSPGEIEFLIEPYWRETTVSRISMECIINRNKLRWMGHVVRMPDSRLPKQFLFGEFSQGARSAGGQIKRYKEATKRTLKICHIPHTSLEDMVQDRAAWRPTVKAGLQRFESERNEWLDERRARRHRLAAVNGVFVCSECGRTVAAAIALNSHLRANRRRRRTGQAGQAVIVDPDGQP